MLRTIALCAVGLLCLVLSGCGQLPIERDLYTPWNHTQLNVSSSADVLSLLQDPNTQARGELLSQSDIVAASWGQKKKGKEQWFNAVAFDEQNAVAIRKYFYYVDEKARRWLILHPKWSAQFNAKIIADPAVLEKAYPNENARRVAILQYVLKTFQDDIAKIQQDNKLLAACRDSINSAFNSIFNTLNDSPAFAANLTEPRGMEFTDPAFYYGRAQLFQHDNIVTVIIKEGAISDSKHLRREPLIEPIEPPLAEPNMPIQ